MSFHWRADSGTKCSIIINWTSPFQFLGLLCGIFHFNSNFNRTFCLANSENPDNSAASDLDLQRLCMSHKKVASLIWVNSYGWQTVEQASKGANGILI